MSDVPHDRVARARGLRIGVVSVLVAVAFLIGLALAVVLPHRQNAQVDLAAVPALIQPAAPATGVAQPPAPVAPQPVADPAALAARETALAGQIAALEARQASLAASAEAAGGEAARAEALLVVTAVRRALDRGVGLGALDPALAGRLGAADPQALATVRDAGRQPVTLEDLREGLAALGPVLTSGANRGWIESLRQGMRTLIVIRRAGTPSPLPADRLQRARRLLDRGAVEAARAEVAQLPGAAQAGAWFAAARRYVLARQALDALEAAALAGRARPAPSPAS
ncbi:hypothetical protein [uncultured Sphingomonas sp.]|uniref:hypothetical protein n=1 Tax=uncultured Sphingomonas sp. TaxID=158754 RepID=UPI0035C98EA1